ncbi:hypothetical protein BGW36DRAFT_365804 [Talaromyces proteolyticus]|uniref:AMP-dependent synthetase/ligase domain-containing protein n=1 Tax=Talaromyces proteolyticus TaxID=1131652 RepID=A0AAD4PRE8_9EURO|nr:uncharacterized protein BGW36DRAFT_365804 [Talaromyces proteolyticus]KAH8688741.1 hypothetical protein BGW36DRAFT_365804 [Talaromyces proteolyticus]
MAGQPQLIQSPYNVDIPVNDIQSWIFSAGIQETRKQPEYFDADNPAKCFSVNDVDLYMKQVALGLQRLGLQPKEKVLPFSTNELYFHVLLWGVTMRLYCCLAICTGDGYVKAQSMVWRTWTFEADAKQSSRTN